MSQLCNRISNLYLLSILKKYIGDESQHKSITLQMNISTEYACSEKSKIVFSFCSSGGV